MANERATIGLIRFRRGDGDMTALINRKTHHIGGVEFRNPRKFQLLAVTVANSAMEGWQPTNEQMIKRILMSMSLFKVHW